MIPLAGRARRCSGGVVVRQALHHLVLAEFRTQLQHGIRKASHDVGERSFRELVEDANAARYDDDHLAGLTSFFQSFGDVRTTDDTVAMLD